MELATIRRRTWTAPTGETKTAWAVDFIDQQGRRRRQQFATKKAADRFMVAARSDVAKGTYIHGPTALTVEEAAREWIEHIRVRTGVDLDPKAARGYRSKMQMHILNPAYGIGRVRLPELTYGVVEDFRLRMVGAGVTAANAGMICTILSMLLGWCTDRHYVASNVMAGRRKQRGGRDEKEIFVPDHDTIKRLIQVATESDPDFAVALRFAAITGLRASEQWGLRWSCVDFDKRVVRVDQRLDDAGRLGPTKSRAGRRTVPLPPGLVSALKERWFRRGRPTDGFVFTDAVGGPVCHSNLMSRRWRPAKAEAGVQMRWHDLRAYAISSWLQAGASVKTVQLRAGHAGHDVTLKVYAKAFNEDAAAELAAVESRLS